MSGHEHRGEGRLAALLLRCAAEKGQLLERVHGLTSELAVTRIERDESRALVALLRADNDQLRRQQADLKQQMQDLLHAIAHSDERLRALLRREFCGTSERLAGDANYIPEILAGLREQEDTVTLTEDGAISQQDPASAQIPGSIAGQDSAQPAGMATSTGITKKPKRPRGRPPNTGGRNPLPEDIERRHSIYVPPEDHPLLASATSYDVIGHRTIERWHVGKLDLHIQSISCPIVRLHLPQQIVCQQTIAPPAVIVRGQVTDALLVQSAVDKVVDHLPAYRQQQRALRLGAHIPRSKLCRWHVALATFLSGVAQAVFDEICASPVIGIDDSVHRLLVPDRQTCQKARIWGVEGPTGIFYLYTPTREGHWISQLLKSYQGNVMGDAYAGHHQLLSRQDIVALFCWAHVRRKFFESHDRPRRRIMLDLIAELYHIESTLRGSTPEERVFQRCAQARPVLARIKTQLDAWGKDPHILPKSGIGRAVVYASKLWPGLERYVFIGQANIDNNALERGMRRVAMHRKNSLFSASVAGAEGYATLLTLAQTALLHRLDPIAYLNDIIEDIHFARRPPQELTPLAYHRRQERAVKKRP